MERTTKSKKLIIAANQNLKEKSYWFNRLAGELVKSSFPYDCKNVSARRQRELVSFDLTGELFSKLMGLCKNSLPRLHITLAAALNALIYKYTGMDDVIIGTPIYKQAGTAEFRAGDFINTALVLRNQVEDGKSFKQLILEMKDVIVGAVDNRNYPVEILAQQLEMPFEEEDDFPLFDIALCLEGIHDKRYLEHLHCNMLFSFSIGKDRIAGCISYNASLYDSGTINRIIEYFTHLLGQAVANIDAPLGEIGILSEEHKQRILFQFNDTVRELGRDKCYYQLFHEAAYRQPESIAAKYNGRRVSYKQLDFEARRIAAFLKGKGVKPNEFVALYLKRSINMLTSIIGTFQCGAAYMPIEVEWPENRVEYILEDSGAGCVIVDEERFEIIRGIRERSKQPIEVLCLGPDGNFVNVQSPESPASGIEESYQNVQPDNLAYMIYTSGTTGTPKGVMIHQLGMLNHIDAKINDLSISADDIIAQTASACFDISVWQFLAGLLVGSRVVIVDKEIVLDGREFLKVLQNEGITILESVPSLMTAFLETASHEEEHALRRLRWMIPTGEPLTVPLVREWFRIYPDIKLLNAYGPTEASDDVTHYIVEDCPPAEKGSISVGKPLQNLHIYIMNKQLSLCPIGVRGEICVAGIGVGKGYWKNPEKTGAAFVPNPYLEEIGDRDYSLLYKTGDIGYLREDGNIECLGRLDYQVKIRGYRIELGEIEIQLLKHEMVKEAVVVVVETGKPGKKDSGEGDKQLCAYVVTHEEIEMKHLREFLGNALPAYMVPSYFMPLNAIPLTPNGKVNRKAFPAPVLDKERRHSPPRGEREITLAGLWAEVLGVNNKDLGRDDNFFELGGHSLSAYMLVSKIYRAFDVKLPLAEIFNAQTLAKQAECIKGAAKEQFRPILPAEEKDYYVLSSAQKRLFVLQQMDREGIGYNESQAVVLEGPLDTEKLGISFNKLIERHETLRTSIDMVDHEPMQRVHKKIDFKIERFSAAEHEVRALIKRFIRPFDLSAAPFLRVGLVEITHDRHILLIDMHHIVTDFVSIIIFIEELVLLYTGQELPEQAIQYKDYAEWQNSDIEREAVLRQEIYWLNKFKGDIPTLELVTDSPRPNEKNYDGDTVFFELSRELSAKVQELVKEAEATLYIVLLAVYNILLSRYSSCEDVIIGCPIEGRTHPDLENVIGMFINMLPMRNYPEKKKTFNQFLVEVRENALKDYENQDYQFEELVNKLELPRIPGRNPLLETVLLLLNQGREMDQRAQEGISELTVKDYDSDMGITKFDLILAINDGDEALKMRLIYSTALFKRSSVEKLTQRFVEIIEQVVENKDIPLHEIAVTHDLLAAQAVGEIDTRGDFAF